MGTATKTATKTAGTRRIRSRVAFTLVELLVVIAIISILAAMLLPALERATEQARRQECAARLKNWGLLMATYVDDFEGFYPWNQRNNTDYTLVDQGSGGYRDTDTKDYLDSRVKHFGQLEYVVTNDEINCPNAKFPRAIAADKWFTRIGYFQVGVGVSGIPLRRVDNPTRQPFMSDNLWMPEGFPAPAEGAGNSYWSHHMPGTPEGANSVHVDGHVQWNGDLYEMWWGPFKGYVTPQRRLIPPDSDGCYTGNDGNQPGW